MCLLDDFELEELDNFKEEYIMDIEHELIQPQPQQRVIILDQVVTKKQDIIVPSTSAVHTKQTKTLPTKDQSLIPTLPSSIVIKKIYPSVVHKKIPVASMLTKKLVTKPPCKNLVPFVRNGFVQIFGKRSEHIYSFIEIIEADKFLYYSGIKKNKFEDLLDKILTYFGKEHCVSASFMFT